MTTEDQKKTGEDPVSYFKRASSIFENLINDNYEKLGIPSPNYEVRNSNQISKILTIFQGQ